MKPAPLPPAFKHKSKLVLGPGHPAINVVVVGAGGTGSMMVGHLARIHTALIRAKISNGLHVTVVDDDVVTTANLGRQAFGASDLGHPKAAALVNRINMFYGTNWEADKVRFNTTTVGPILTNSIVISCVDTIASRLSISRAIRRQRCYWMDLGNTMDTGQVVLGESEGEFLRRGEGRKRTLPHLFDLYPQLRRTKDRDTEPSCSLLEALTKQDLFINSTLANFGGQLLWQLIRKGGLNHHGYFINLASGRVQPIPIP